MTRSRLVFAGGALAIVTSVLILLAFTLTGSAHGPSPEVLARRTALEFLDSINARRFERTCRLLSARFYRENHVPDKARCVLALRIGFTWAPSFRFRILGVHVDGHRAIVRAVASGAPGKIVLVEEAGRLRVLSVRGS